MTKNDSSSIKKFYQEKFNEYGVDPRSLLWKGKGAAHQRFRQFWAEIDFSNKSVLDIGCGFGEFAKFLDKRYENVTYTGVDIVPEFIEEAKKNFPHHTFYCQDFFNEPLTTSFDVIIASGVLNSNVSDNMEYRQKAIKAMFEHTKGVLAFNTLGSHPQPENEKESNVWYSDSLEILKYCMSLTRRVILRHHYHPKDYTVFLYPVKKGV